MPSPLLIQDVEDRWERIAADVEGKTKAQCFKRWSQNLPPALIRKRCLFVEALNVPFNLPVCWRVNYWCPVDHLERCCLQI